MEICCFPSPATPCRRRGAGSEDHGRVHSRQRLLRGETHDCGHHNSTPTNNDRLNHKHTARLMRQMGLFGYTRKRRVKTTVSAKRAPKFPDLLKRRFTAEKPNKVYLGDITYLPIADGSNMYLATIIDCY